MKWKRIPKEKCVQPESGTYHDWKSILAEEASYQCVYCAIHEGSFGGTRNFHVEHYRPKSKFGELENDIMNLFYACAICNTFKGDDWPSEPLQDFSNPSYPDPSETNYNDLFFSITVKGEIQGRYIASKYLAEKLYLNRPQLIIERRISSITSRLTDIQRIAVNLASGLMANGNGKARDYLGRLVKVLAKICELQRIIHVLRPYDQMDVRRPA